MVFGMLECTAIDAKQSVMVGPYLDMLRSVAWKRKQQIIGKLDDGSVVNFVAFG